MIILKDKALLLWHYGLKCALILYWIFGKNNMVTISYNIISAVFYFMHEWSAFFIFTLKSLPDCERLNDYEDHKLPKLY